MKSSIAVFSNQGNPFAAPARRRTKYHPSQPQPQPLTTEKKQTVLIPSRLQSLPAHLSDSLSPADLRFLGKSQQLVTGLPESDTSGPFDESLPSTEANSSKTPERDDTLNSGDTGLKNARPDLPSNELPTDDSVIARYMARFRNARPTSRLERSPPKPDTNDFWWLETSADSPDIDRYRSETGFRSSSGFTTQNLERTPPQGDGSFGDSKLYSEDINIMRLQERAEKLVLMSESSLSSGDPVSSDGVGSSPLSSISNPESGHSRTNPHSPLQPASVAPIKFQPRVWAPPSVRHPPLLAPEEDILYQWRLRRKMEQAREGTLPLTTRGRNTSPPVRIPKQVVSTTDFAASVHYGQSKEATDPCVPDPLYEQQNILGPSCSSFPIASPTLHPQTPITAVPPHLHFLCDILPCTKIQHSAPDAGQRPENVNLGLQHSQQPTAPTTQVQQRKPAHGQQKQEPSSKTPEKKELRRSEKAEDRKAKPRKEKPRRQRSRARPSEDHSQCVGEEALRDSPVHRAVEEVISERLFSPVPSTRQKSEVRKSDRATPPVELTSQQQQSLELAAQLLEEAEDSDGTEFEDDPLLQVLREQREALRAKLRAVDRRVSELEDQLH